MRLGVSPYGSDRAETIAFADAAVAGGIDALWLGDGMFRRPDFAGWRGGLESMVELAWFSGRHPAARIGITAAVLPVRDMDWLVRQAATLDHLTEGRFVLAVAPGFWADELAYRGVPPDERGRRFRECLDELRASLAGEVLSPEPFTPGGPPIWLAGASETMRLAARLGLPYQASRALPAELAPLAARFRDLGGGVLAHRIYVEAGTAVPDGVQVARHVLAGSAEQLLDGLARYRELGVADLSMVLGHDDPTARRTLDVLLTDVLPRL
ncbi:LLM class flavin-dependent oxidoreductase [Frankia sp. CNm7]|uniref:LLM class flavin-dependent oxidoreductase n=1 Tax=Frankia nepalensis TaxID=1836974 RepID=A0A937RSC2_9ACTN|nr:LLM class flavin-dependent oxidoreductase [Frankia nepalensis]MBL7499479.1 LLM class flavin-dependent oxidoreductase [Frankia nepalensis]MBL7515366.1 LLM class flavin-dependent oxidoreductase [Frankia nepalensis]MBL7523083.1 LLM class flavin-dependent oxidoreductase [Frankia nepalensis]MBL7631853.1 LLM class flavin-dependent oxidoreductase [Frankia nepalensis]